MSQKCDGVNPNILRYQGTTTQVSGNYAPLRMTYIGRSSPGYVSALPTKTESVNLQLLQVVPQYGGDGLSTRTMYGSTQDGEHTAPGTSYATLQGMSAKTNPYCTQKNF